VHTQDFVVDEGCDRQAVETICEDFPELNGVSAFAFVVESVNSINAGALVVSSKKEEVLRVLDLVGK
jgi:malonyl CoA-acyl carrier protein transacylase